jgi:hypothetical protein
MVLLRRVRCCRPPLETTLSGVRMSADDGEVEIDLSDVAEACEGCVEADAALRRAEQEAELTAAWERVLADARREEAPVVASQKDAGSEAAGRTDESDAPVTQPETGPSANAALTLTPDFEHWTADQYQRWIDGLGIDPALQALGVRLANAMRGYGPAVETPPTASVGRAGWDDVPIDVIIDSIAAGTLVLPVPTVGMLADGSGGLFYPGRVNGLAGDSGAGKGWIALTVAAEQMGLGRHVYYLDFEDSPELAMLRLLKVLRVDPDLVRRLFHYLHPSSHDDAGIAELVKRVSLTPEAFVVIDSTGESIAAAGLNQNHDEEVAAWFQSLANPLAFLGGACVVLLDHMAKGADGGLWPIGSQRKRAAITGAQYVVEVADPFNKSKDGMVALRVAKDRHGEWVVESVAAYVQFQHPAESITTLPDGSVDVVLSEALKVILGVGKTADQIKADRDAKAAAALDADVTDLDNLTPPPMSQRDVIARMSWGGKRAADALREWRARQPGSPS